MGAVCIRHSIWEIATQASHCVDAAGWQAKMASIELWIQWCNAHGPHSLQQSVTGVWNWVKKNCPVHVVCVFQMQPFVFLPLRPRRVFSLFLVTRAHWFFPTLEEKKTREKTRSATFCAPVRLRYRVRFVTHCVAFVTVFLCLWLPAETAVVQDLCLVEGNTKIEICRGKWGFFLHILLDELALDWCNIEMPNNATLAWWLIMRTSRKRYRRSMRVELAGEAGDVFDVLCFFISLPHWFFSSM